MNDMLVQTLLLVIVSYVLFLLTTNTLNPLTYKGPPFRKRQFKLGRAVLWASMAAGVLALVLIHLANFDTRLALGVYLCAGCLLLAPSIVKYRRSALWR